MYTFSLLWLVLLVPGWGLWFSRIIFLWSAFTGLALFKWPRQLGSHDVLCVASSAYYQPRLNGCHFAVCRWIVEVRGSIERWWCTVVKDIIWSTQDMYFFYKEKRQGHLLGDYFFLHAHGVIYFFALQIIWICICIINFMFFHAYLCEAPFVSYSVWLHSIVSGKYLWSHCTFDLLIHDR